MSNKLSLAQFEDFPPSNRRHYAPQDQLGPGLAPVDEARTLPVSLARTRQAHDTAEQLDPASEGEAAGVVSTSGSGSAPMMSSYQAMQAGVSLEPKKRAGKRIVAPQGAATGGSLFFGGAAPGPRAEPPVALTLGTTKQSPHVPGYTGHIPKTSSAADPAPARTTDKSLIIENFKPYGPAYTGRRM